MVLSSPSNNKREPEAAAAGTRDGNGSRRAERSETERNISVFQCDRWQDDVKFTCRAMRASARLLYCCHRCRLHFAASPRLLQRLRRKGWGDAFPSTFFFSFLSFRTSLPPPSPPAPSARVACTLHFSEICLSILRNVVAIFVCFRCHWHCIRLTMRRMCTSVCQQYLPVVCIYQKLDKHRKKGKCSSERENGGKKVERKTIFAFASSSLERVRRKCVCSRLADAVLCKYCNLLAFEMNDTSFGALFRIPFDGFDE